ncbi:MAG TPA: glycosyltransferase family 4 protein [Candidatus Saccharimonadales bacterium]|nr:glycosyltransferase family 4 protein [Candidatus Saccharimonadales bacterium]
MISFVWSDPLPIYSGRGGSESFTIGQIREMRERGLEARVISIGLGKKDGRQFFRDIPFLDMSKPDGLSELDDTLVFVSRPIDVKTVRKSYVMLHTQPLADPRQKSKYRRLLKDRGIIVNSLFNKRLWTEYLNVHPGRIAVVHPFADPSFAKVRRSHQVFRGAGRKVRVLYAGRLCSEKGIYILLEALHHKILKRGYTFTVTTAGNQTQEGKDIEMMLRAHPRLKVVEARHTPSETAKMFARHQVVVMPSNPTFWIEPFGYWRETFGMISVEAQHAGCYVVASNDGGLKETDCGGLILFEPANSYSLALNIQKAAHAGAMTIKQRKEAIKHFTRAESVDAMLAVLKIKD